MPKLKDCAYCKTKVPEHGQCNKCGFIDGITRRPGKDDFLKARKVNDNAKYDQFKSIDMIFLLE